MLMLDSHCHLDRELGHPEIDATLGRARAAGLVAAINIGGGDGLDYARFAVEVAGRHEDVFAAVAVHPHDAAILDNQILHDLRSLCSHPLVVAVGETGLDFHYDHSPRETQISAFRSFIRLARELSLPLSLHIREAHVRAREILSEECFEHGAASVRGVVHCFSAGPKDAAAYLDMGLYISIPGIVTFRKAADLCAAVPQIPSGRLLVETDSPFLAPVPKRGKRNEPAYMIHTVHKVAELRGEEPEEVGLRTARNAIELFSLPETLLAGHVGNGLIGGPVGVLDTSGEAD